MTETAPLVHDVFPQAALQDGLLVGRVWQPAAPAGPTVVWLDRDGVFDLSPLSATMSGLLERPGLSQLRATFAREAPLSSLESLIENSLRLRQGGTPPGPWLLAPCDLQVIKACGVTFAASALERVIEERTRGDPKLADEMRRIVTESLATDMGRIVPGSDAAAELKERMLSLNSWSQYLEVAFGSDAEVFSMASPLSAVGFGAEVGIHRRSSWNNPEPEVVLAVNSRGETVGASLGNDVNLRDFEGRSALLLGKAKDNNGACAIGPAIRVFDATFAMDDVRGAEVALQIDGPKGFQAAGHSSMREISRDPLDLVGQTIGPHHQYPDGLMLFLGTLFAPVQDREGPGLRFTHRVGDRVTIRAPGFGSVVNWVNYSDAIPPWTFGIRELVGNLQKRGLLR